MRTISLISILGGALAFGVTGTAAAADKKPSVSAKPSKADTVSLQRYQQDRAQQTKDYLSRSKEHPRLSLPRGHYRPMLDTTLKLRPNVTKVRAEIVQIVDGMVVYIPEGSVDRTRFKRIAQIPKNALRRATFARGVEALARRKVGDTVMLHLQADPKGFAYVTNVTR